MKYSREFLEIEGLIKKDLRKTFFNATNVADESVDPNGNIESKTLINFESEFSKREMKLDQIKLLRKKATQMYGKFTAEEIIRGHIEGDFYINDLTGFHKPYCYNFSTFDIALFGLPFFKDKQSEPPKNFISFVDQVIQFSIYASNSVVGAVGLADFLIVLAYFVDKEPFSYRLVKQKIQSFIYSCNQPYTRGSNQSGFYSISIYDKYFLDELLPSYIFPDGKPKIETIFMLQDIFLETMGETFGKNIMTFPIVTACFNTDEYGIIRHRIYFAEVCRRNVDYGFINFFFGKTSTISNCCRLRSDNLYYNQLGSGGTKIGSIGVVTLNLPRLGYSENFEEDLEHYCLLAIKINHIKRTIIQDYELLGALPLYTHHFIDIETQYSTIGLVGIAEMLANRGLDITQKEGQDFVKRMLELINSINHDAGNALGFPHNLEQVPAENSAIKLAQKDRLKYSNSYELYSNQFVPLTAQADILDRIKIQGLFDSEMTGGSILHLNLEKPNLETMKGLLELAALRRVVYVGINYNLQKCENGHITPGHNQICRICRGKIMDNFSRVVGFIVNTKNMAKTRRELEYPARRFY